MKIFPRSFTGRTVLMVIVPMALSLLIVGEAFFGDHWARVQRDLSRGLAGEIGAIMKLTDTNPALANKMASDIGINVTENEKLNRPEKNDNARREVGYLANELRKKVNAKPQIYIEKSRRLLFIDIPHKDNMMTFATTLRRVYSSSTEAFILWIIGAMLIASLATTPFIIAHARSIRSIAAAANKFGRGLSAPDFRPSGSREIREAGLALITMKSRLDRYNRTRSDMLNAVSHDLKSPLARMRLAIETGTVDNKKLMGEIDRMTEMVNGYLTFARGEVPEIEQKISIAPVLERVVRDVNSSKKISLNMSDIEVDFYARPNAISSALQNIIDNAVRYAKHKIDITEKNTLDHIEITIDDDGIGIPADRRAEALRPFARLDESRPVATGGTGGTGLGLNIAQTAIENHGGQLFLEDSPLGGLRVRIILPV